MRRPWGPGLWRLVPGLAACSIGGMAGPAAGWGNLLLIEAPPSASTLAVGATVWSLPAFPGARRNELTVLPGLDFYAPSGLFVSTDSGLGWNLSPRQDLQAGLRLWPQLGRSRADTPAGVAAVGARLQLEAFANYAPSPALLLQSGLLHGAGRSHDGRQLELGVTSGLPLGADLLGVGVATTWANRAFRQSYLGVSDDEAAASGLPARRLGSGWHDVSLTLSSEHRFDARWRLSGQFIVARLLGPVQAAPLTPSARQTALSVTLWRDL